MLRKAGLGRGLDALLGENEGDLPGMDAGNRGAEARLDERAPEASANSDGPVALIALDRLAAGPGQPRRNFDEAEMRELADSIAKHGVIQPIVAERLGDGSFAIIAGERRTRASRLAGLSEIPAIVVGEYSDQKRLEVSLIENIQRSDLNPIEEAAAYKKLMDLAGLSQEELAARVGKNRSTVANALRLLRLPDDMQKSLESGGISPGHARALLSVQDDRSREKLFREILDDGLNVREAEKRASAPSVGRSAAEGEKTAAKPSAVRPPEIVEMEERFIERLGTKVHIEGGPEKGRVYIEYYSMEDLDRLYGILGGAGNG